ncbi:MAG: Poly-gamma-glutamate synthase subunit PgsB/CapB [Candidatus Saccharicenans subterraneus]|uniref:Poly-gamma-glutamate synthase subunit PgsB/CapB n=1 Tax=Candidatus Saccharicenans subterraneus TaxID=2508984 RepID=A0A3E2BP71_9BACT|nr:MAG: Poly-gamma-glutamate synthase subunit PgsB/CapB [Candidatus Saccharicenans subterraneum]
MLHQAGLIAPFSLLILIIYLSVEAVHFRRRLKKIPVRIAVGGIRGKSSITRLIAWGLRQAGLKVMAKTTGSRPVLIYPDGHEQEISRRGRPTILEQKKLVEVAAAAESDFLVSEMMSIQPECLGAEGRHLLRPQVLVLSNFRPDHTEFLGRHREEVARALLEAVPAGTIVFIPEEEFQPWMGNLAREKGFELMAVRSSIESARLTEILPYPEFEPNARLALAVLQHFGLSAERVQDGWSGLNPDLGRPRVWRVRVSGKHHFHLVSLFAANDPESSLLAMELITRRLGWQEARKIGLLSLRADRGDRSRQWVEFLQSGAADFLESLILIGPGARAVGRKLRNWSRKTGRPLLILPEREPEKGLEEIKKLVADCQKRLPGAEERCLVFGLGNIGGFGRKLIEYLERTADAVRI